MNKFNIRVYGILIHQKKVLLLKEPFAEKIITKFPGGGLEIGESTIDCIKREFLEELNLTLNNVTHFYTQDFWVNTMVYKEYQLQTIYYKVECESLNNLRVLDNSIEKLIWTPINELELDLVDLPVDKVVIKKLKLSNS